MGKANYLDVNKNPWWLKDFNPKSLPEWGLTPRFAFEQLKKLFYGTDLIIIIKGLRRLGKTTLLKQLIIDVLQKEVYAPENIYFVEFTETANDLAQVLSAIPDKSLLIVDEIQYCKKWKDLLKVFYDTYPQKRVIVTGSSRLDTEKKGEPLVGRFMPLTLTPLTFLEFLTIKYGYGFHKGLITQKEWEEYLFYGEFPATLKMADPQIKSQYIKEAVLIPILTKDISFYDIDKRTEFNKFFMVVASNMCQELSKKNMSAEVGISRQTLGKYINVLVDLGIAVLLPNYYKSIRKSMASTKKLVCVSTNLALASLNLTDLSNPALRDFYGHVFENAVINNIMLTRGSDSVFYYWREAKKELDLVAVKNGLIDAWKVKPSDAVGDKMLKMYARYANALGAKDFKLIHKGNFLEALTITS